MYHFRDIPSSQRKSLYTKRDSSIVEKNIFRFSIFPRKKKANEKHENIINYFNNYLSDLFPSPSPSKNLEGRLDIYREEDVAERTRGKEERFKDSRGSNGGTISLEELASIRIVKVSRARLYRALDQHCKDLQFQLHP